MASGFERIEYDVPGLAEDEVAADPVAQFSNWFQQAAHLTESNVMMVATAAADGRPSVRAVLLKGFDARGFVFFTNHGSQKGRQLRANPWAEGCILWQALHRQVRVAGPVAPIERAESDAYWATRPRDAQIASIASRQSSVLAGRPSLGAWTVYGLGSENEDLPSFVVLTDRDAKPFNGTRNWGTGFMPSTYQGTQFKFGDEPVANLKNPAGVSNARQRGRIDFINQLNRRHAEPRTFQTDLEARINAYELAYQRLASLVGSEYLQQFGSSQ